MKNFLLGFFTSTLLVAVFVVFHNYEHQDTLLFKTLALHEKHHFSFRHDNEELYLKTSDEGRIHALHFKQANPKGVIYFLHGNSKNLDFHAHRAEMFVEAGYDFFSIDYRGFGKSSHGLREAWLLEDGMVGYDYLLTQYDEDQITVVGHSLGSAMATYVASKTTPKSLVLEAPFYSMIAAAKFTKPFLPEWLLSVICKYPLRTEAWIDSVRSPIYIFHGTNDDIVPHWQGLKLYEKVKMGGNAQFFTLDGWGHEDLQHHLGYQEQIWGILGSDKPDQVVGCEFDLSDEMFEAVGS